MTEKEYYVGFDIGTDSIGMALTDTTYRVLKYKGKAMWFVRLFDESMTAAERRAFRSGTRRTARKRERISFLQMLFNSAIAEKDEAFFQRLKESNLYEDDKTVVTPYAVFADNDYTDKDYHRDYPTIYHLRKELIVNPEPHDVRLVYLALHHLIKHRGHFLFDSLNASDSHSFDVIFRELQAYLDEEYGIQINCDVPDALGDVLKDRKRTINAKFADGIKLCDINKKTDKRAAAVIALICGKSESASVLFDEEITDENGKLLKIELKGDYETKSVDYAKCLGDKFELIEKLKAVYDWAILADVLGDEKYISFAKVKSYNQHGNDLKTLKAYVKQNCPEKYREIFKISKDNLDNYTAYSGMIKKNGKTGVLKNTCNQEEFCKYLLKAFKNLPQNGYEEMFSGLESASFMPKQHIKDNGVIPMQINRAELEKILENASGYSPAVKRPILQSIKMLNEVVKALGKPPKKIFVEMTRGEQEKKRTVSRKDQLLESYKTIKKDAGELYDTLNGLDNDRLRQDKLYLYFTQLGKCMYTGEPIAFDSLFDNNLYDIDHIYPRSKVKDDSLTNRVLVKKKDNAEKDNTYPLSGEIRKKMSAHWKFLLDKGLINKEKFKRLTRVEPLTDDELSDFISRQIVETSQSTKAVAQILDQMYPDSDVVYVKARNVSEFRHNNDLLKCRDVNDLHHAKDAYLNIVVGNVYDVLYTRNKANFIAGLQTKKYSLNQMFSFNIKGAWTADKSESLNVVKRMMNKNNIIYTRYSSCQHGSLFKLLPLKKGSGQVPLTNHGARSDIEKYGGYDKPLSTYFTLGD